MVRSEAMICLMFSKFSTIHFSLLGMPADVSNQHVEETTAASRGSPLACEIRASWETNQCTRISAARALPQDDV